MSDQGEKEDTLAPLPSSTSRRQRTSSDLSRNEAMMGSLVRRRRVSHFYPSLSFLMMIKKAHFPLLCRLSRCLLETVLSSLL